MPAARPWPAPPSRFSGRSPRRRGGAPSFAFGDKERVNWHYVPRGREGVPFKAMPAPARAAAQELMKASLSEVGYAKAINVIRLETVLRQLETFGGLMRDPENYSVSVFGAPDSPGAPWGWRLEGHHLSLNFTLVPGKPVAVTPAFFGANPAEVRSGPLKGLRTLAREQDLGRALAQGMDASQRRRMIIAAQSLGDIVSGPGREESLAAQAGLPASDLAPAQRDLLIAARRRVRAQHATRDGRGAIFGASGREASSAFTSRGPARSIPVTRTTTAFTGRACSSSSTTRRTTPITSTRCGTIRGTSSAPISSARTTSAGTGTTTPEEGAGPG